jgi:beta-phosphoglucomutase
MPAIRTGHRAVIFDLDGVLVSSAPVHWEAFRRTFAEEGRAFPWEEYLELGIGASRDEVIRRVFGDLPPARMGRLMDAKERHVRDCLKSGGLEPIPGSLEFVKRLRSKGVRTAVATASRTPQLLLEAVGAAMLFDAIVGRHEVERSKPHPDLYLRAAERLGLAAEDCVVIEDSPVGIEAGLSAGMTVLAITTTEEPEKLSRAHAVYAGCQDIPLEDWIRTAP